MPSTPFLDLMGQLSSLDVDKFKGFQVLKTEYKILENSSSAISTDILIPKVVLEKKGLGKCPIIVRIHGGFLVTGSSHYAPWFSNWILDYAVRSEALIVSPNYRLLPEANGEDISKDMDDFWNWLQTGGLAESLEQLDKPSLSADLDRILMLGESAGGYLAIQLALSHPSKVRGVVAAYPMLDLKSRFYTERYSKPIVGVPNLPESLVEDHLTNNQANSIPEITSADPPDRLELAFSIVQNARFLEFFGTQNCDMFPLERIKQLKASTGSKLPPFFIFHGEQDSAVPVEGSRKFVSLLQAKFPTVNAQLYVQEGDHGFDADATLETPWLRKGLSMASSAWSSPELSISHL